MALKPPSPKAGTRKTSASASPSATASGPLAENALTASSCTDGALDSCATSSPSSNSCSKKRRRSSVTLVMPRSSSTLSIVMGASRSLHSALLAKSDSTHLLCNDANHSITVKRSRTDGSPVAHLKELFSRHDPKTLLFPSGHNNNNNNATKTSSSLPHYDMETCQAIRSGDVIALQQLHAQGKPLNAANPFGESLLHMACRRGNVDVIRFLLEQARVDASVYDDMGRNVLHDACWTPCANLDVMELLLQHVPLRLLLEPDRRNHTPLDYARREHWSQWNEFLHEHQASWEHQLRAASPISTSSCHDAAPATRALEAAMGNTNR